MSLAVSQRISDRLVLSNGIVVLVTENPTADIIAGRCFFAGGERAETPAKSGLTHLAASLLTRG
ncbi:MAG: insulinase family protein, partial [Pseudanabaena sp.]